MREGRGVRGARDPQTQWLTDTGAVDPWRPRHTLTPSPAGRREESVAVLRHRREEADSWPVHPHHDQLPPPFWILGR